MEISQPIQTVTKVSGSHLAHLTNNQVKAFDIRRENCQYLPQKVLNYFTNVELLQVMNSKLKVITQADLKPFTKLRVLHLIANQLKSLEQNLFQFNTELVRIDFSHQQIKFISYNLLDNLGKLALADFQSSGCVNIYSIGQEGIDNLKRDFRINCQPMEDIIGELKILKERVELLEGEGGSRNQLKQIEDEQNFKKLDAKLRKLQEDNVKCFNGLESVTRNFALLAGKLDASEKALQTKLDKTKRETCEVQEYAYQKCMGENENLQRLRREANFVNIVCESSEWSKMSIARQTCDVKSLVIIEPDIEIKSVQSTSLNQEFNASSIEEIKIFNERVTFLPLQLSKYFQNLMSLSFVGCGLMTIDKKAFIGLKKLRSLILSYNKIAEIPAGNFVDLQSLTLLDLSHNKILTLDNDAFQPLKELSTLKLNDNQLSELTPQVFFNQAKLMFLFLNNNQLALIPPKLLVPTKLLAFADFSSNKCINIESSNPLKDLEAAFEKCSKKYQNEIKT